jgi:hypothetical protein
MSLLSRLQKVQKETTMDGLADVTCWADMNEELITFGKAHKGKTFLELFETDENYVEWFVSHCSPPSAVQKKFHRYIELRIENQEKDLGIGEANSSTEKPNQKEKSEPKPKSKVKSEAKPEVTKMTPPLWEAEAVVIPVDHPQNRGTMEKLEELYGHMAHLEHQGTTTAQLLQEQCHRTQRLEGVLEEMVNQIRGLNTNLLRVKEEQT